MKSMLGGGAGSERSNTIATIVYMLLMIGGQYILNLSLTSEMCGQANPSAAFAITAIPWTMIFGLMTIALTIFPGFLSPFSNTLGYLITKIAGLDGEMEKNLRPDANTDSMDNDTISLVRALEHIKGDYSLFINEIGISNIVDSDKWASLSKIFNPKIGPAFRSTIGSFLIMKDVVAEMIWYLLTGSFVTSVSYNALVSRGCNVSVAEMKERHDDYVIKQAEMAANPEKEIKYIVTE